MGIHHFLFNLSENLRSLGSFENAHAVSVLDYFLIVLSLSKLKFREGRNGVALIVTHYKS